MSLYNIRYLFMDTTKKLKMSNSTYLYFIYSGDKKKSTSQSLNSLPRTQCRNSIARVSAPASLSYSKAALVTAYRYFTYLIPRLLFTIACSSCTLDGRE